jgi:acetylornithine deacetylase/succinyl-diaminopimelate desuccinylase-like protein
MVDPDYLTNGLMEKAMDLTDQYVNKLGIKGIKRNEYKNDKGMKLVTYVIDATHGSTKNCMMYGHLDKQPYGEGWREDLSPTEPKIEGELMYGRGGADDGYSIFSCMLAIKTLQQLDQPCPRCCMVLEQEEESGSPNLIELLNMAAEDIGQPDALFCMDSGAFDYEQLWVTSSLRGICIVDCKVEVGKAGYHSGETGGIVPETFRVIR